MKTYVVKTGNDHGVNIRFSPFINGRFIYTIPNGEVVDEIDNVKTIYPYIPVYYELRGKSIIGYVDCTFLKRVVA